MLLSPAIYNLHAAEWQPSTPGGCLQGFGAAFSFMAQREWGRGVLLKYPRLFSYGRWCRLMGLAAA